MKLDPFLEERHIKVYSRERFVRRTARRNPIVDVDYSLFLDEKYRFKKHLTPLLRNTMHRFDLQVYFVMVSWWGRGDEALWTGSHLLNTLKRFRKEGLCRILLSYQEGGKPPSSLCSWCRRNKIEVFHADRFRLLNDENKRVVVPKISQGKAENVMKGLKWIERKTRTEGRSPGRVLVIFVDDDYTQYHWINYFMLFALWVFSFAKKPVDPEIDPILKKARRISLIKSGSPRIILPYELQEQIVSGRMPPMDYRHVTQAVIDLASSQQRSGLTQTGTETARLTETLRKIKYSGRVYSPANREELLGSGMNAILNRIWREYIYRGGRVTQRLEGIFRCLSHKSHCRWLRQFTFLLHGDQGAPLSAWLEFSPFSGYALEISLLMQAICDKSFENQQVLNIVGLPHSHQRSKELAIWHMFDTILLALDLLQVFYRHLSIRSFLSLHKHKRYFPMLDRFGNVIRHTPQYGELTVYPPLKGLRLA